MFLCLLLTKIQEHDHEQEENHNSTGIDENFQYGEEIGLQEKIYQCERKKARNQQDGTVNSIPVEDY
jgi:hypothetical protein